MKSKRMVQILFASIMSLVLLSMSPTHSIACEMDYDVIETNSTGSQSDDFVKPQYNTVCGNLPYHKMYSHGWADCILPNGDVYINVLNGKMWQCANCNSVLVTEGDIYNNHMSTIGKWGSAMWNDRITTPVSSVYANNWGYCGSNTLSGYKFYYNAY